jgi:hypothetical protein
MDTQQKIENRVGAKITDRKYNKTCLQGISEAFEDKGKDICSKVWKKFGCNGDDLPRLVQENSFKKADANLCEY